MIARLAVLGAMAGLIACGPSRATTAGFVIDMKSTSLTVVESFTLRTPEGVEQVFQVGSLELDGGAFPAAHLREHMALAQPIAVAWVEQDGERVAIELVDAPWLTP